MLKTRFKNWILRRRRRKLEKEMSRVRKKSQKLKNREMYDEWYGENGWQFESIDLEVRRNESRDLRDHAEMLYLPIPDFSDKEKWEEIDFMWVLKPQAIKELRAAIREEKRERRDAIEAWARIIGAVASILVGVIGALIGLVAIWKK